MTRTTLRLDTALLERRLWLSQLAKRRGLTLEHARDWEASTRHWACVARWVGAGIIATFLMILWGMP